MATAEQYPYAAAFSLTARSRGVEKLRSGVKCAGALFLALNGLFLPSRAAAVDEALTERTGGSVTVEYESARAWMAKRNWSEAVVVLRKLEGRTTSPEFAFDFAKALVYSGRREEALGVLTRASVRQSGPVRATMIRRSKVISRLFLTNATFLVYQEGLNFLSAQQYRAAKERLEKALDQEPDNVEILVRLGQAMLLSGDVDSAAERLRLAKKLNPHQIEIRLWLGHALALRGELPASLEELRAANDSMKDSEEAESWYADALAQSGQKQFAIQVLDKNLRTRPLHLRSLVNMAKLKLQVSGGRESQLLWSIRKDLQLAQSRLADYESYKPAPTPESLVLDLRDIVGIKAEITEISQKVEARLAAVPSSTES